MNVRLRHVRAFAIVAEERSFARAAERLHVSQPALSQTIIQLEELVGFALFERTTRNVSLTGNGERLLAKALPIVKAMEGFHAEVRTIQLSQRNQLRVGYMIGTAVELIPDIVREFELCRPGGQLSFIEFDFSDPTAGLRELTVDCGIFRPPIDVDGIEIVELTRERCVACLPSGHRLASRDEVHLEDILDEPIIAAPVPGPWRDYWLANQHRNGSPANVVFEAATVESELQAVATGKGISITADSTAKYYARPGVAFRKIVDMPECAIAIGYRGKPNGPLADFMTVATKVAQARSHVP